MSKMFSDVLRKFQAFDLLSKVKVLAFQGFVVPLKVLKLLLERQYLRFKLRKMLRENHDLLLESEMLQSMIAQATAERITEKARSTPDATD